MASEVPYPKVYGFWTNKGGVGKTTLAFHMATTYAELFPEKVVVAIDMCPQCNLSATLLTNTTQTHREPGDEVVKDFRDKKKAAGPIPKTIGGYFMTQIRAGRNVQVAPEDFLIDAKVHNVNLPGNLMLVCGDSSLDLLAPRLSKLADGKRDETGDPFEDVHYFLRNLIEGLAKYYARSQKPPELVVFIDTNPALSVYTEIALCAMTHLVMPVSADTFSLQAVNSMYHLVYGLYPTTGPAQAYEEDSFAYKMKRCQSLRLPGIATIIHNRNPICSDKAGKAKSVNAFQVMANEQCQRLFDGYNKAIAAHELERVFSVIRNEDKSPVIYTTLAEFADAYTANIRDMRSCGVAAVHSGFPLWKIVDKFECIDSLFKKSGDLKLSVPGLIRDVLYAMEVMTGTSWWSADESALKRLQMMAGPPAGTSPQKDAPEKAQQG